MLCVQQSASSYVRVSDEALPCLLSHYGEVLRQTHAQDKNRESRTGCYCTSIAIHKAYLILAADLRSHQAFSRSKNPSSVASQSQDRHQKAPSSRHGPAGRASTRLLGSRRRVAAVVCRSALPKTCEFSISSLPPHKTLRAAGTLQQIADRLR